VSDGGLGWVVKDRVGDHLVITASGEEVYLGTFEGGQTTAVFLDRDGALEVARALTDAADHIT
jgi:hypothetical protein